MRNFTRFLSLACLVGFLHFNVSSQTDVTVGANSGSNGSGSTTTSYFHGPLPDYYKTNKAQFLYTASDLTAAGLTAGNFTKIGWTVTATNSAGLIENYTISLKNTSSTSLTAYETGMTDVYGPINYTPTLGLNQFTLASSFNWDGTSNVVIQICGGLATGSFTSNASCVYTTISGYTGSRWYRLDTGTGVCAQTTTTATSTTQRPQVVITGTIVSCLPTSSSAATNITATTAQTNWGSSTGNFIIEYGPTSAFGTPGTGATASGSNILATATNTNLKVLTSLTASTSYSYVIRQDCSVSSNGYSTNSTVRTFTTLAPPPANDDPCGAISLTVGSSCTFVQYTNATATATATTSGGAIPVPGCSSYLGGDVWFSVTVPASGALIFDSNTGVMLDGGMALYSSSDNTCNGLFSLIDCDDDASVNGAMPYLSKTGLTAGSTVFIRFFEYANDNNGTFSICVSTPPAVPVCATLNTPTTGATGVVLNTPLTWTAAVTGGTPVSYKVFLGTATNPSQLTTVAYPTATYTPSGQAYSTTYYWRIVPTNSTGDAVGCSTEFSYTTEAIPPPPANDLCANAEGIIQSAGTTTYSGTTVAATNSSPALGGTCSGTSSTVAPDVWYAFTATATGTVTLNLAASHDSQIAVYGTSCPGASTACLAGDDDYASGEPVNPIGDSNDPKSIILSVTANAIYYVRVYGYNGATGSFTLQVVSNVALPLELHSFTGKTSSTTNMLLWETLTEKNVQWHIVERSVDGIKWMEVGKKAGQMDSNSSVKYELEDRLPLAKAYYRLRSVDFDGAENLSNTIVLTRKSEDFGITAAFPSPTKDQITIQFSSLQEENVTIRITDIAGRLVLEQQFAADNGINEVPVQLAKLQAGLYLVRISNANQTAAPVRIVKE